MSNEYTRMVEGCRRRDAKAQRALYDAMAPMAMGVCMRYARDREQAQDLLQDGFIKVYENLSKLREPEKLGAWVYHIMINVCINHCRAAKPQTYIEDCAADAVTLPLDPFAAEEIVKALQQLSAPLRTVFNLVEVEGYSIEEVAQELKMQPSSVRSALCRAKAQLRTYLTR